MSYEKQNFKDGQVIVADNLILMEDGIINAEVVYVTITSTSADGGTTYTSNYTVSNILDLLTSNRQVVLVYTNEAGVTRYNVVQYLAGQSVTASAIIVNADNSVEARRIYMSTSEGVDTISAVNTVLNVATA